MSFITDIIGGFVQKNQYDTLAKREQGALDAQKNYISPALLDAIGMGQKRMNASMYAGQDVDQANVNRSANNAYSNVARSTTSGTNLANSALAIQGQQNIANQGIQRNLAQYKDQSAKDFTSLLLQKANAQYGQKRYNDQIQGSIWQNQAAGSNAVWNGFAKAENDNENKMNQVASLALMA